MSTKVAQTGIAQTVKTPIHPRFQDVTAKHQEVLKDAPCLKLVRRTYPCGSVCLTRLRRSIGEDSWSKIDHLIY